MGARLERGRAKLAVETRSRAIRVDIPGAKPSPDVLRRIARERVLTAHQEDDLGRRVDGEVVKEISFDGPLSLPDTL